MNLIKFPGKDPGELFQSLDIKFALLKKINENIFEQVHKEVKCRDFLGDCIWSQKTGNTVNIYGFNYSFKNNPFDTDKLYLSLHFPNKKSFTNFKNNDIIKPGFNIITYDFNLENHLIIEANPIWLSTIWKMSLFTFYLKLLSYPTPQEAKDPEDEYLNLLTPEIEQKFLQNLNNNEEILENDIYKAHNYSGFVSIINGNNNKMKEILNV